MDLFIKFAEFGSLWKTPQHAPKPRVSGSNPLGYATFIKYLPKVCGIEKNRSVG